jgi:hypothetical protein
MKMMIRRIKMGYDYAELIENYNNCKWASARFHENEEEANKEMEYIASRLKEKFSEIRVLVHLNPNRRGAPCFLMNTSAWMYFSQRRPPCTHLSS